MVMRRVVVRIGFAVVLLVGSAGCATEGSRSLECDSTGVSPSSQKGETSGRKALDAYVKVSAKTSGIPTSGYRLDHATKTRETYVSGPVTIAVGTLGVPDSKEPVWVVQQTFTCPE